MQFSICPDVVRCLGVVFPCLCRSELRRLSSLSLPSPAAVVLMTLTIFFRLWALILVGWLACGAVRRELKRKRAIRPPDVCSRFRASARSPAWSHLAAHEHAGPHGRCVQLLDAMKREACDDHRVLDLRSKDQTEYSRRERLPTVKRSGEFPRWSPT